MTTLLMYIFGAALFLTFSLRPASKADWTWRQMRIRMRRVGPTACLIVGVWVVLATTLLCLGDLARIAAVVTGQMAGALVVIGASVTGIREAGPPAVETA